MSFVSPPVRARKARKTALNSVEATAGVAESNEPPAAELSAQGSESIAASSTGCMPCLELLRTSVLLKRGKDYDAEGRIQCRKTSIAAFAAKVEMTCCVPWSGRR